MSDAMARHYDPPIAEADFDGRVQQKTVQQRLRTLEVVKLMYGENDVIKEAEAYLIASSDRPPPPARRRRGWYRG